MQPLHQPLQRGDARGQPLGHDAQMGWNQHAILAMMPRGGAAFDGILKLFAAGAAGSGTLTGSNWSGHEILFQGKRG